LKKLTALALILLMAIPLVACAFNFKAKADGTFVSLYVSPSNEANDRISGQHVNFDFTEVYAYLSAHEGSEIASVSNYIYTKASDLDFPDGAIQCSSYVRYGDTGPDTDVFDNLLYLDESYLHTSVWTYVDYAYFLPFITTGINYFWIFTYSTNSTNTLLYDIGDLEVSVYLPEPSPTPTPTATGTASPTATPTPSYLIRFGVWDGSGTTTPSGTEELYQDLTVAISATASEGYHFAQWFIQYPASGTIDDPYSASTYYTVGTANANVWAIFVEDGEPTPTVPPTPSPTPIPSGTPAVTGALGDSYVIQSSPNLNEGTQPRIDLEHGPGIITTIGIIGFDLTNYTTQTIVSAQLVLFRTSSQYYGDKPTIDLYLCGNSWSENTVTYGNIPVDGALIASGVPIEFNGEATYINVTSEVQYAVLHMLYNTSISFKLYAGSDTQIVSFASKEHENSAWHPRLDINAVATEPTPTPSASPLPGSSVINPFNFGDWILYLIYALIIAGFCALTAVVIHSSQRNGKGK
jgi:hypothetical protein